LGVDHDVNNYWSKISVVKVFRQLRVPICPLYTFQGPSGGQELLELKPKVQD